MKWKIVFVCGLLALATACVKVPPNIGSPLRLGISNLWTGLEQRALIPADFKHPSFPANPRRLEELSANNSTDNAITVFSHSYFDPNTEYLSYLLHWGSMRDRVEAMYGVDLKNKKIERLELPSGVPIIISTNPQWNQGKMYYEMLGHILAVDIAKKELHIRRDFDPLSLMAYDGYLYFFHEQKLIQSNLVTGQERSFDIPVSFASIEDISDDHSKVFLSISDQNKIFGIFSHQKAFKVAFTPLEDNYYDYLLDLNTGDITKLQTRLSPGRNDIPISPVAYDHEFSPSTRYLKARFDKDSAQETIEHTHIYELPTYKLVGDYKVDWGVWLPEERLLTFDSQGEGRQIRIVDVATQEVKGELTLPVLENQELANSYFGNSQILYSNTQPRYLVFQYTRQLEFIDLETFEAFTIAKEQIFGAQQTDSPPTPLGHVDHLWFDSATQKIKLFSLSSLMQSPPVFKLYEVDMSQKQLKEVLSFSN